MVFFKENLGASWAADMFLKIYPLAIFLALKGSSRLKFWNKGRVCFLVLGSLQAQIVTVD